MNRQVQWYPTPTPVIEFSVAGQGSSTVRISLRGAVPTGSYWLLPKLMWHGRVGYGPSIAFAVAG
ncbi:hypothetical protein [Jatrophihabitans lederbergiae]|uniref:Uncharacterized protein n=1 Tax=Jatrophihabitans lederbergiae TaxID=3075547 RepID=A0ABU2JH23_9ACTN|nr:hypothetical protein [Jatrophihabitans sp. DSM 44399]MDT0263994.1 hypothetical protein [Jatrophihabitans sp. DSM 44399]